MLKASEALGYSVESTASEKEPSISGGSEDRRLRGAHCIVASMHLGK